MLAPVYFDDKPVLEANEVNDVVSERLLAFELIASESSRPQRVPELPFGIGLIAP